MHTQIETWVKKNRWIVCALTIEYALFIFLLSSIPTSPTLEDAPGGEYISTPEKAIEHAIEYMILGFLIYLSLTNTGKTSKNWLTYILSISLSILYAISDEIHQNYVPGRVMSANDVIFDTIGALVGVTLASYVWKMGKKEEC